MFDDFSIRAAGLGLLFLGRARSRNELGDGLYASVNRRDDNFIAGLLFDPRNAIGQKRFIDRAAAINNGLVKWRGIPKTGFGPL